MRNSNLTKFQLANKLIQQKKIFEIFEYFNPEFVGTIPIGIDTENSDIDIIFDLKDKKLEFKNLVLKYFSKEKSFNLIETNQFIQADFEYKKIKFQFYAEEKSTHKQFAYRHFKIEERILLIAGDEFREKIIQLKKTGLNTEHAFCKLLRQKGNPFYSILKLEKLSDSELKNFIITSSESESD